MFGNPAFYSRQAPFAKLFRKKRAGDLQSWDLSDGPDQQPAA